MENELVQFRQVEVRLRQTGDRLEFARMNRLLLKFLLRFHFGFIDFVVAGQDAAVGRALIEHEFPVRCQFIHIHDRHTPPLDIAQFHWRKAIGQILHHSFTVGEQLGNFLQIRLRVFLPATKHIAPRWPCPFLLHPKNHNAATRI